MKDRQPTKVLANGAIRYGIYNEDGTLNHYEYMKREDSPTVEGTPLNKANLLSDETAAKIWPGSNKPEDPTVNDALNKLSQGTAKVGDIAITSRTDLSTAWLPCDGRLVSEADYPQLHALLRASATNLPWTNFTVPGIETGTFSSIVTANGKWFALHIDQVTDIDSNAGTITYRVQLHIHESDDLVTWSEHTVLLDDTTTSQSKDGIALWLAAATYYNGNYYFAFYWSYYLGSSNHSCQYVCSINANLDTCLLGKNYYGAGGKRLKIIVTPDSMNVFDWSNNDCHILVTSDSGASWNDATVGYLKDVTYDYTSGEFISMHRNGSVLTIYTSSSALQLSATILHSISWADIWPDLVASKYQAVFADAVFDDVTHRLIIIMGNGSSNSAAASYGYSYAFSDDYGATWTKGTVFTNSQTDTYTDFSATFVNGLFACSIYLHSLSGYALCILTDPSKGFVAMPSPNIITYPIALTSNGVAASSRLEKTSGDGRGTFAKCDYSISAKPVPTISPDDRSHAYIKALEE